VQGTYGAGMRLARSTGMPVVDANDDFSRARRRHLAARASGWLVPGRRRARAPLTLGEVVLPTGKPRLEVIPLKAIVGTVEPTTTFDARFRPASELVRKRWERIALAHRKGIALPPITVRRCPDGYYVADGRHRVSVASALGHRDIDAWVTATEQPAPALASAA
jgi:ParB-like nuclease family protein